MMPPTCGLYQVAAAPATEVRRRTSSVTIGRAYLQRRPAGVWPPTDLGPDLGIGLPESSRQTGVRKPRSSMSVFPCGFVSASVRAGVPPIRRGTGGGGEGRENHPRTG